MAKNTIGDTTTLSQNDTKQQRKKLAKREAKLMLQIDQVSKDFHRIEQKIVKAQAKLEATKTNLQDLEGKLAHVRTLLGSSNGHPFADVVQTPAESAETVAVAPEQNGADAGADAQSAIEIMHLEAAPPVEGRTDVGEGEATEDAVESVLTTEASKGAEDDTPAAIVEPTASSADLEAVAGSTDLEASAGVDENGGETEGSVEEGAKSPTTRSKARRRTTSRRQTQSDSDDTNPEKA